MHVEQSPLDEYVSDQQSSHLAPWQVPIGMEAYLQTTPLCNFEHPALQAKAVELIEGTQTPRQAAMRIFDFVRDQVEFGLVYPIGETALMTLERGRGQCSAKANLQVALLRVAGIPARYHVVGVDRASLRGLVPGTIYRLFSSPLWHPWAECYLDGQWIGCDTLIDRPLYRSALQKGLIDSTEIPTIDWDGQEALWVLKPWIMETVGDFARLDDAIAQMPKAMIPPRVVANIAFAYSNRYTAKLRSGQ
jgi:transglutaminase-like putative cysteine protease